MAAPHLKLKLELPDDCWILTATASSSVFSAQGRTGIDPKKLIHFADELSAYPITAERTPELLGGTVRDGKLLEAGHYFVRIAIQPATTKGLLQARIGLGEAPSSPDDAGLRPSRWDQIRMSQMNDPPYFPYYRAVGVAFPVEYQAIVDFASAIRGLVNETVEEALLHSAFL